eukprot:763217-Prymnesium_polylepis.1
MHTHVCGHSVCEPGDSAERSRRRRACCFLAAALDARAQPRCAHDPFHATQHAYAASLPHARPIASGATAACRRARPA